MKNLAKATLKEFVEMNDKEMKLVVGGSGGSGGSGECSATGMHQCSGSCPDVIDYWTSNGLPVYKQTTCQDTEGGCMCV